MPFLVIFIVIPFMELMVFANVSEHIGLFTALSMAFLTAVIGGMIVRKQGLQTIAAMQTSLNQGAVPLSELFDGFCLVAAGATLITPGFITDALGFLLLIPTFRNVLRRLIKDHTSWSAAAQPKHDPAQPSVLEAEYERVDD